jgi:hypothetical protein
LALVGKQKTSQSPQLCEVGPHLYHKNQCSQSSEHQLFRIKNTLPPSFIETLLIVIQEASQGDNEVANKRLNTLSGIPILRITDKSQFIAQSLIDENAIPSAFEEDALHIAIASANGINLLLTWNFKHINNVFTKSKIIRCIENQGLIAPEICSPDEILGG